MNVFKVTTGLHPQYPINEENFTRETGRKSPFVQEMGNGKKSYYAVCPNCDNPIQIIGLFKDTPEAGRKPYGKHHKGDVPALARYSEQRYLGCPFSNPAWRKKRVKRKPHSKEGKEICDLLREQYDRITYLISKFTGIRITEKLARQILQDFKNDTGWDYRDIEPGNLPWTLLISSKSISLFGKYIREGSGLYQAILEKCPEVKLEKSPGSSWVKITNADGQYVDLGFVVFKHKYTLVGEDLHETITLLVSRGHALKNNLESVYEETVEVDRNYFANLVHSDKNESRRMLALCELAKEVLGNG